LKEELITTNLGKTGTGRQLLWILWPEVIETVFSIVLLKSLITQELTTEQTSALWQYSTPYSQWTASLLDLSHRPSLYVWMWGVRLRNLGRKIGRKLGQHLTVSVGPWCVKGSAHKEKGY
jgi:hypothetical protein